MDRYCSYYGTKLRENGNFCEGCGRKILDEEMQKKQIEEKLRSELKEEVEKEFEKEQIIKKDKVNLASTPINLRNISFDFCISLIIAVGLIAISIMICGVAFGAFNKTNIFVFELVFPFRWFKMTNTEIGISSLLNLLLDFIFYMLICFIVFLAYDYYKF